MALVLAHHSGWQDGDTQRKRERGSSAWRGNVDATWYLEAGAHDRARGEVRLTLRALKVRDAERPAPLHLIRRRVELPELAGDDLRQGPLTSCVIELDPRTREDHEAEQEVVTKAAHRQCDLKVLRALRDHELTSQREIRSCVKGSATVISDSILRLVQLKWAEKPSRQRQPYTVTEAGQAALSGVVPSDSE
jgi:hypothetical protein